MSQPCTRWLRLHLLGKTRTRGGSEAHRIDHAFQRNPEAYWLRQRVVYDKEEKINEIEILLVCLTHDRGVFIDQHKKHFQIRKKFLKMNSVSTCEGISSLNDVLPSKLTFYILNFQKNHSYMLESSYSFPRNNV
jgi:hypothetical protein